MTQINVPLVPGLFNPLNPTEDEVVYSNIRARLSVPAECKAALVDLASRSSDSCFVDRRSLLFRANVGPSDAEAVSRMCELYLEHDTFEFRPSDFTVRRPFCGTLRSSSFETIAMKLIRAGQASGTWVAVPMEPSEHYDIDQLHPDTVLRMHQQGWLNQTADGWLLSFQALRTIARSGDGEYLTPEARARFCIWFAASLSVSGLQSSISCLPHSWHRHASTLGPFHCYRLIAENRDRADGYKLPFLGEMLKGNTFIGVATACVRSLELESMIVARIEELQSQSEARDAIKYLSNQELAGRLEKVIQQV